MFRLAAKTNRLAACAPHLWYPRNPWSFLKIFSLFSNFGRQILEKDDERKNDQFKTSNRK